MVKLNTAIALLLMAIVPLMSGCKKDKEDDYAEKDDQIIQEYIAAHNLVAEKTISGIYYVIDEPGSDKHPTINNDVRVTYSGYYTDGVTFDGNTATFGLAGVIKGWIEALQLMPVGSKWKLFIPSDLAYGDRGQGSIPGGAALIFDIELLEIVGQ